MSRRDNTTRTHSDRLNERVDDGSGCAETWETLSTMRDDGTGRRGFLAHVGVTIGALGAGGSLLSDGASAATDSSGLETTPVRGRERGQLLKRANNSADVHEVATVLGEKPGVDRVLEYESATESGYAVTFGDPESRGTSITYYESDAIEGGTTAKGGTPVGDGVRGATAGEETVTVDFGTPLVQSVARKVPDDAMTAATGSGEFARHQSILVRGDDRFDVYVPVTQGDEVVGRVVMTSAVAASAVSTGDLSVAPKRDTDGVSTQGHVVCGPWGTVCTDYCTILCSSLAGLAGAACTAACAGTVAGIPISPACGAICAGVVGGTCYATCTNLTGH